MPPENQKVAVWIPSQGTCLGFRPGPQLGAQEKQAHIDVSPPLFPSLPLSLKINIQKKEKDITKTLYLGSFPIPATL